MKHGLIHALVAVMGTIGLMTAPAAQALPPVPLASECSQWGFAGRSIIDETGTPWYVEFYSGGLRAVGGATASNGSDTKKGSFAAESPRMAATTSPSTTTTVNTSSTPAWWVSMASPAG